MSFYLNTKILLFGATGLLGNALRAVLQDKSELVCPAHSQNQAKALDIRDLKKINEIFAHEKPDVCINAVAISDPLLCEKDPKKCQQLNVEAVRNLVKISKRYNSLFVFFSTDYIFDGNSNSGYSEEDPPAPLQLYGRTKAEAEKYLHEYENSLTLRLPLLYGSLNKQTKNDFIKSVLGSLRENKDLKINDSQIRYPTFTKDVAEIVWALIQKGERGTYHISANDATTKYHWAKMIATKTNLSVDHIRKDVKSFDEKKPINSHLLINKLRKMVNYKFTSLEEGTKRVIASLNL